MGMAVDKTEGEKGTARENCGTRPGSSPRVLSHSYPDMFSIASDA